MSDEKEKIPNTNEYFIRYKTGLLIELSKHESVEERLLVLADQMANLCARMRTLLDVLHNHTEAINQLYAGMGARMTEIAQLELLVRNLVAIVAERLPELEIDKKIKIPSIQ